MLMAAGAVSAQYTQEKPNVEYMFKIEAGYLHKVANYGKPQADAASTNIEGSGFRFNLHEEAMGLNIINGINISQDFFLGGGVGYAFCAPMRPVRFDKSSHMAVAFIDTALTSRCMPVSTGSTTMLCSRWTRTTTASSPRWVSSWFSKPFSSPSV